MDKNKIIKILMLIVTIVYVASPIDLCSGCMIDDIILVLVEHFLRKKCLPATV